MGRNTELVFATNFIHYEQVCKYLDDESYGFSFLINKRLVIFKVEVGHDPGKAGRCFDIGQAVAKIELTSHIHTPKQK